MSTIAQEARAIEPYTLNSFVHRVVDASCKTTSVETLSDRFPELTSIGFKSPSIWDSDAIDGLRFVYNEVEFEGQYGTAKGVVTCDARPQDNALLEIGFIFEGSGLAGFVPVPGSEDRMTIGMFVSKDPAPISAN